MIVRILLLVCYVGYAEALMCNKCTNLDFQSSVINLPGIGESCNLVRCNDGEVCFGMKGEVTADIGPINTKSTLNIQACIAKLEFVASPLPVCEKADLKYVNMLLKGAKILMDGTNVQINGYSCTCSADACDSICEHGFLIADKVCVPYWVIGVTATGVGIFLLLCICCCCCCLKCCCFRRTVIPPVAANPVIILHQGHNGYDGPSYSRGYANNSLPAYEYISNEDDASLIKP